MKDSQLIARYLNKQYEIITNELPQGFIKSAVYKELSDIFGFDWEAIHKGVAFWASLGGVSSKKWRGDVHWDFREEESLTDALSPYCTEEVTNEEAKMVMKMSQELIREYNRNILINYEDNFKSHSFFTKEQRDAVYSAANKQIQELE